MYTRCTHHITMQLWKPDLLIRRQQVLFKFCELVTLKSFNRPWTIIFQKENGVTYCKKVSERNGRAHHKKNRVPDSFYKGNNILYRQDQFLACHLHIGIVVLNIRVPPLLGMRHENNLTGQYEKLCKKKMLLDFLNGDPYDDPDDTTPNAAICIRHPSKVRA